MADTAPPSQPLDPMALWRDAVAQWEKGINDVAGQTMRSPEFAKGMQGAMGTSLSMQKGVADAMGRLLTALNLPSRAEVAALGERLTDIESRLIRMTTLLEHLGDPASATGIGRGAVVAIPRTKRPPAPPSRAEPDPAAEAVVAKRAARKSARTRR